MNDMIPGSTGLWTVLACVAVGVVALCFCPIGLVEMADYYAIHPGELGLDAFIVVAGLIGIVAVIWVQTRLSRLS